MVLNLLLINGKWDGTFSGLSSFVLHFSSSSFPPFFSFLSISLHSRKCLSGCHLSDYFHHPWLNDCFLFVSFLISVLQLFPSSMRAQKRGFLPTLLRTCRAQRTSRLSETILTTTDVPSFSGLQSPHPHPCGHIDRPKRGGSDGLFVCNILAKIEWAIFYSASRRAELLLHCSTFFFSDKDGKDFILPFFSLTVASHCVTFLPSRMWYMNATSQLHY